MLFIRKRIKVKVKVRRTLREIFLKLLTIVIIKLATIKATTL